MAAPGSLTLAEGQSSPAGTSDAALIRMGQELEAGVLRWKQAEASYMTLPDDAAQAVIAAAEDEHDRLYEACAALARRIFQTPAATADGMQVKFGAVRAMHWDDDVDENMGIMKAWRSIEADVERTEGGRP